ncbi:MAG TPA: phosphomannomutase/phosphoglucomutase [Candidatus Paceibacterota bacterium]|nr:phosphomannomutase/phosphoglucomutase [Candidatus Paceibacterota bacterium]
MSNIFRAYDVRGVYPDELNEGIAEKIAGATAKFLNAKKLVVGEDARVSSPVLRKAVLDGATKAGCDVHYIGRCTTPLFYFSVNKLGADGGIMVTASHNPPQYNGLKIVGPGATPIASISGLFKIRDMVNEVTESSVNKGAVQTTSFLNEYIDFLARETKFKHKNTKFIVDASNGMAPVVLEPLFEKLDLKPIQINFDINGSFPGHSPDISKKENLEQLKNKILETGAEVGFAFDGDADRLTVLDEKGEKLPSEFVVGLLFKAQAGLFKKPKVAHDLRFSKSVRELFGKNGFPSPTGYVFVRKKMKEVDADLGGELAGHFDFKEMNYAESAVLAMLKTLGIVSSSGKRLSELVAPFKKYFNSGEVNIPIDQNDDLKSEIMENLKNKHSDGKQNFLDGIMVEYPDWWFNVRFSNTEPIVRVVVEANTQELMERRVRETTSEIKKIP